MRPSRTSQITTSQIDLVDPAGTRSAIRQGPRLRRPLRACRALRGAPGRPVSALVTNAPQALGRGAFVWFWPCCGA